MAMVENNSLSASITSNLKTRFIGQRVIYYPTLTSTMDVAKREARQGAIEGLVVITSEQTAGRGRINRIWLSPKGSVALSIILYPSLDYLPFLIMLASLGVVHSIEAVTGLRSMIKWPNDVLINGKKVCGILIESDVRGDIVNYAIIGIGVNVNIGISDLPEIQTTATSLSDELGRDVSHLSLIQQLLVEIERLYLTLPDGKPIYEEWRDNLGMIGSKVWVRSGKILYQGVAESVAKDGSLLLRQSDGNLTRIIAGDVMLREQA
jgi:BirA family biotin operon repressor/biotin-[acetyl-CoA-carboxylase] ligase